MRYSFLFGLMLVSFYCAAQKKIDTSSYAVIKYNPSEMTYLFKNEIKESTSISTADIEIIDSLLNVCTTEYKENEYNRNKNTAIKLQKDEYLYDLKKYKRQLVSIVGKNNQRIVWVNCFVPRFRDDGTIDEDWRNYPVTVDDGGKAYFNVKINLTKKEFCDMYVNGY